jgi:hypothetical protein
MRETLSPMAKGREASIALLTAAGATASSQGAMRGSVSAPTCSQSQARFSRAALRLPRARPAFTAAPFKRPGGGAGNARDLDLVALQQPVEHAPGKGPVRAAALQREVDPLGLGHGL